MSCHVKAIPVVLQYSHEELKRLIDIHINDPVAQAESGLTSSDGQLIIGAFDYKHKRYANAGYSPAIPLLHEVWFSCHAASAISSREVMHKDTIMCMCLLRANRQSFTHSSLAA